MIDRGLAGSVEWAAAGRPIPGVRVSGDLHLVAPSANGVTIAVVDGLGHGAHAETAARAAIDVIARAPDRPVAEIVARCHEPLSRLRGVVMSVASIDTRIGSLSWIGIGNVEAILMRFAPSPGRPARERLLVWGGIVGQTRPLLRAATLNIAAGDTMVMATDGIGPGFADDLGRGVAVEELAGSILAQHATGADDALVLAARYRGIT